MCCCTSLKGWFCLGWTISSIVLAVLAAVIFVAIHISLGGPFPVDHWHSGADLVYVSATFTVISGVLLMITIINFSENIIKMNFVIRWVVFGIVNFALAVSILVTLTAAPIIAKPIGAKDVIDYCKAYRDTHDGKMPPALHGLESHSRIFEDGGLPLGCCGYNNITDYIKPPIEQCDPNNTTQNHDLRQFNVPKSCCKSTLDCEAKSLKKFPQNTFAQYELPYFIYRFWIKNITKGTEKDRHELEKKLLADFFDWLSGYEGNNQTTTFADNELPAKSSTVLGKRFDNYKPKDCAAPLKSLLNMSLGDWNNVTYWTSDAGKVNESRLDAYGREEVDKDGVVLLYVGYAKTRKNLWQNYKKFMMERVKANVLGCGELIELLMAGNAFISIQPWGYAKFIQAVRGCIIALVVFLFLHTVLNAVWFNYYYVPHVLFRGKCNLPFFPKKEVTRSVQHSVTVKVETPRVSAKPSPTQADKPEEPMAEAEAAQ